jgi:hypothetical protein
MLATRRHIFIDLRGPSGQSAITLPEYPRLFAVEERFSRTIRVGFGRVVESFLQRGSPTPTSLAFCCPALYWEPARAGVSRNRTLSRFHVVNLYTPC